MTLESTLENIFHLLTLLGIARRTAFLRVNHMGDSPDTMPTILSPIRKEGTP